MKSLSFNELNAIPMINKWFSQILPLVFTDEFSYIENIAQLQDKVNELIKNNNALPDVLYNMVLSYVEREGMESVLADLIHNFMINVKYPPENIPAAKGDGITDDSASIKQCIAYAQNNGNLPVFLPSGTYLCDPLDLTSADFSTGYLTLIGYSVETTRLKARNITQPLIYSYSNSGRVELINIRLDGSNIDGDLVQIDNVNRLTLDNCRFENASDLLTIDRSAFIRVNNCLFNSFTDYGVYISISALNQPRVCSFNACSFYSTSGSINSAFYNHGVNNLILASATFNCSSGSPIDNSANNCTYIYSTLQNVSPLDSGLNNNFITAGNTISLSAATGNISLESSNGNFNASGNNTEISAVTNNKIVGENVIIDSTNPVKISSETTAAINSYFSYLPIRDSSGNTFQALIAGANITDLAKEKFTQIHNVTNNPLRIYIDGDHGDDNSTNPTNINTPIKTLNKFFDLINSEGRTEIRGFIIAGGIYNVDNIDCINACTIHLSANVDNVKINFTSHNGYDTVFYNSHVNFNVGSTHEMEIASADGMYFENSAVACENVKMTDIGGDNATGQITFYGCYISLDTVKAKAVNFKGCSGGVRNLNIEQTIYKLVPIRITDGSCLNFYGGENNFSALTANLTEDTPTQRYIECSTVYFSHADKVCDSYPIHIEAQGSVLMFTGETGWIRLQSFFNNATYPRYGVAVNNPILKYTQITALNQTSETELPRIVLNGVECVYDSSNTSQPFTATNTPVIPS